jgi:hypothetical protein
MPAPARGPAVSLPGPGQALGGGPGTFKLTFTLDLPREAAERLSAPAIRKGVNLDAVVVNIPSKDGGT